MIALLEHLLIVPIVAPLLAGALQLFLTDRRAIRITCAVGSVVAQAATALALLYLTTDSMPDMWTDGVGVYALGSWPAPFGIVLAVDRLAALMLVLTSLVALASLVYSLAYWDQAAPAFHSLFQFLLMGLNGAFLTGDLFNLFVFFEILLASSYGLLLHGSGVSRVKASLHYITVNLVASFLFLIGIAIIYGMTGTLNMADLAGRVAQLAARDRALFESGAAILSVAFLIKAAAWPLNFWLPNTYVSASSPVGAVFSLMTKVGIYAVLRIGTLLAAGNETTSFIDAGLFYIGAATVAFAAIGMLASRQIGRIVSYCVVTSAGLLFMALGLRIDALTGPLILYLVSSVLATSAFFMVNGLAQRSRTLPLREAADLTTPPDLTYAGFGIRQSDPLSPQDEVGRAIPGAMAFLGLTFVCCVLLVAGLPPLSGFLAKFALLRTAIGSARDAAVDWHVWVFAGTTVATGIVSTIALMRGGLRLFWSSTGRTTPRLSIIEAGPAAFLVMLSVALTAGIAPVMTFLDSTAQSLHSPEIYIRVVKATRESAP